jgi:protein tyrosine phosphatase (PTP) superfamily phosphohydrolase (DUF442 family)
VIDIKRVEQQSNYSINLACQSCKSEDNLNGIMVMIKNNRPVRIKRVPSPVKSIFARKLWILLAVSSLAFAWVTVSSASSDTRGNKFSLPLTTDEVEVDVDNFGKVTDFYYRGAQPKGEEYEQLASIGVKTVIDLRNDPKDYARSLAESAGMKYINFPMSDKDYPASTAAVGFLSLINDRAHWPVYVHCAGGRHRTGAMTAVFRMTIQGWDVDRAYEEMKDYDFYTRWGHKAMKQYVYDYFRGLNTDKPAYTVGSLK